MQKLHFHVLDLQGVGTIILQLYKTNWNIRKMLYRNSVLPSKNSNIQDLENKDESISIGIFSLSLEKNIYVDKEFIGEEIIDEEVLSFSYLDDHDYTFSHYH